MPVLCVSVKTNRAEIINLLLSYIKYLFIPVTKCTHIKLFYMHLQQLHKHTQ
jgi:hypothetical protein